MSKTPIIIGVLALMVCSSSSVAAFMTGGNGDSAPTPATAPAPTPATGPAPTPATEPAPTPATEPAPASTNVGPLEGYANFESLVVKSEEKSCQDDMSLNACKTKCNYDSKCLAFTYDSNAKKCCTTEQITDVKYNEEFITFVKTMPKYKITTLGDREGGDIEVITTDLEGCASECEKNNSCMGFSFQKDRCVLKKEEGLASRYTDTAQQFYERKEKPTPGLTSGLYSLTGGRGGKNCADEDGRVICDRPHVLGWEKFTIEPLGDNKYTLRGGRGGKYCADESEKVVCNRDHVGGWEKFTIEPLGDNKYALRGGQFNKYCADESEKVVCNRDAVGGWEKFTINKL